MVGKTSFRKAYHSAKTVNATVHVRSYISVGFCVYMYVSTPAIKCCYIYLLL